MIKSERKFWRKVQLFGTVYVLIATVACYFINSFLGNKLLPTTFVLIIGLFGVLIMPLLGSRKLTGRKVRNDDLANIEKELEESISQKIADTFGRKVFERLYHEEISQMPVQGIGFCQNLLAKSLNNSDEDLSFGLHITIARFYEKDHDYKNSISQLLKTVSIKPQNLIANIRLAQNYEWIGSGDKAIESYKKALKDPVAVKESIKNFINAQIKIVKKHGPRKAQPITGYRYATH
ncbi:MAG: hypothetical protein QNJ58_24050 [Desulfobacterales bacterium]|nr:hypothetical protein [Desulfobacterales bacterium]